MTAPLRSQQRSDERMARALAVLETDERQQCHRIVAAEQKHVADPWPWRGEEPPPFDEYCVLLDGKPMFDRQVDAWDKPQLLTAADLFNVFSLRTIVEWVLIWGKGAGKDYLAAKFISYCAYCILNLREDPATFMARRAQLDLAPRTRLDCVNVAPNQDLAKNIFFAYLKEFINNPIFAPYPKQRILPGSEKIFFRDTPLVLHSLHSRSSGLDGFNLLTWVLDEADAFRNALGQSNAEEIHRIFRSSSNSRFGPFQIGMDITYPRLEDGFILRLEKRARQNPQIYYVDKARTVEVRPNFDMNSPQVREEYEYDPLAARAMYDCIPMTAGDPFFEFPERIAEAVDASRSPVAIVRETDVERGFRDGGMAYYVSAILEAIHPQAGCNYFISADAGLKGDAFVLAVMHSDETPDAPDWICPYCATHSAFRRFADYERLEQNLVNDEPVRCGFCYQTPLFRTPITGRRGWWRKRAITHTPLTINGRAFPLPHIYEDLVVQIKPRHAGITDTVNRPVDFVGMEELLRQLVEALQPVKVRVDPWNTARMVQGLIAATGVDAAEISFAAPEQFKRARLVKAMLYSHLLTLLPNERRDTEWKRLERTGNGTKIDHPEGGSKDIFDTESICIWEAAIYKCEELKAIW